MQTELVVSLGGEELLGCAGGLSRACDVHDSPAAAGKGDGLCAAISGGARNPSEVMKQLCGRGEECSSCRGRPLRSYQSWTLCPDPDRATKANHPTHTHPLCSSSRSSGHCWGVCGRVEANGYSTVPLTNSCHGGFSSSPGNDSPAL